MAFCTLTVFRTLTLMLLIIFLKSNKSDISFEKKNGTNIKTFDLVTGIFFCVHKGIKCP